MKVLFVCNNAFTRGNGLCTSIQVTRKHLKAAGVEAKILSVENPDPDGKQPDFPLRHFKFPIFEPLIKNNGFCFAVIDKEIVRKAVEWADVVHLEEGFPLQSKTADIARQMGKPCVATFHLFPQNIMYNIGPLKAPILNASILLWWKKTVFDKCSHIQCPTTVVRDYLKEHGFKAELECIPNGVVLKDEPVKVVVPQMDPVIILCIGRLTREKSPETLMEAMRYTKYADRIQLHFAGIGSRRRHYMNLADKMYRNGVFKRPAEFGFYTKEELKELARKAYLYVHCAKVEVEGLSCLEAVREGLVPIISSCRYVATSQFALDDRSVYPACDAKALAQRIDWWIEHPEERIRMGQVYADSVHKYDIRKSIASLIDMYKRAIEG